jgi:RimJ/RimL family protein N-acetyltransferase
VRWRSDRGGRPGSLDPWAQAPALRGRLLALEPLRVEHAAEMAAVLEDPDLHRFIGGAPSTHEELVRTYRRLVDGSSDSSVLWLNWVVRRAADEQAVGTTQATIEATEAGVVAEVAWVVGTPYQGVGYATEAALTMVTWIRSRGAVAVMAHVHPAHDASAAVARGVGLVPTTTLVDGEVRWVGE